MCDLRKADNNNTINTPNFNSADQTTRVHSGLDLKRQSRKHRDKAVEWRVENGHGYTIEKGIEKKKS